MFMKLITRTLTTSTILILFYYINKEEALLKGVEVNSFFLGVFMAVIVFAGIDYLYVFEEKDKRRID